MPTVPFELNVVRDSQSATVTLSGGLGLATVPRVEEALDTTLAADVQTLTVDLSRLSFVDSSGVSGVEDNLPFVEDTRVT